jgi:hypothetical protein
VAFIEAVRMNLLLTGCLYLKQNQIKYNFRYHSVAIKVALLDKVSFVDTTNDIFMFFYNFILSIEIDREQAFFLAKENANQKKISA